MPQNKIAKCVFLYESTLTGVEKNNDDVRNFHLRKSNKWDAPKDILLVSKRLQVTSKQERVRRSYNKRNSEYWSTEINETRSKRRKLFDSHEPELQETNSESVLNITSLTVSEIKDKLQELGVRTRVRKLEKLQVILKKALEDESLQ